MVYGRSDSARGDIADAMNSRALGAISDSMVVEMLGLGAMAFESMPAQREALGRFSYPRTTRRASTACWRLLTPLSLRSFSTSA
jgi:hypothetical protein